MRRVIFLAILLTVGTGAAARTWTVPGDAPTIRAAADSALAGDTILVAAGTHLEFAIPLGADITLRGAGSGPAETVIDAQRRGRVLDCTGGQAGVVVENLTLRGGATTDAWLESMGGGIRVLDSEVSLRRCILNQNWASLGAGLGALNATVTVDSCTFDGNRATHENWAGGGGLWCRFTTGEILQSTFTDNSALSTELPGDGGGVLTESGRLLVSDCVFEANVTGHGAGGFYSVNADSSVLERCTFVDNEATYGGAVYLEESFARLFDCTLRDNRATSGGAMLIGRDSAPVIENCVLENNRSTLWSGGAVDCWQSDVVFTNCRFRRNSSEEHGGAINVSSTQVLLEDCLLEGNIAEVRGGAVKGHYADLQLVGCTLVGNAAVAGGGVACGTTSQVSLERTIIAFGTLGTSIDTGINSAVMLSCCDLWANQGGDWVGPIVVLLGINGNIHADPLFCDRIAGDFHLDAASPCAPEHSQGCGLIGARPVGCEVVGADSEAGLPRTLRLEPGVPNPFNPRTTIAYELPAVGAARLVVFDVAGHRVRVLLDDARSAGRHEVVWDGRDDHGRTVPAGIYLVEMTGPGGRATGRLVLVR